MGLERGVTKEEVMKILDDFDEVSRRVGVGEGVSVVDVEERWSMYGVEERTMGMVDENRKKVRGGGEARANEASLKGEGKSVDSHNGNISYAG